MQPLAGALTAAAVIATAAAVAVAAPPRVATLLAAGDIASCSSDGDTLTAAILAHTPGTIAALGDLAYEVGSTDEIRNCYGRTWGPFLDRTHAALGNHEYGTGNASAAIAYFHLPPSGWYSYRLGTWHVVVLNSNCSSVGGCDVGSPQWRWLKADLEAHPTRCTLAYWHHPRWSSGLHGDTAWMQPLWALLARFHADVVLSGHDHDYERFAPIDGIREFVVGTGGRSHYPLRLLRHRTSVVANGDTFGVLRLTLRPTGYSWRFLPVAGSTFTDAGAGSCG